MTRQKLGFIGIGLMGEAMTRNLLDRGYAVTVWNLEPERLALLLLGVPFLHASFALPDDRTLPADAQSRRASDVLRTDFESRDTSPLFVVSLDRTDPAGINAYAVALSAPRVGSSAARASANPS